MHDDNLITNQLLDIREIVGGLDARFDGLDSKVDSFIERQDNREERHEKREERYAKRLGKLEGDVVALEGDAKLVKRVFGGLFGLLIAAVVAVANFLKP